MSSAFRMIHSVSRKDRRILRGRGAEVEKHKDDLRRERRNEHQMLREEKYLTWLSYNKLFKTNMFEYWKAIEKKIVNEVGENATPKNKCITVKLFVIAWYI